ncbi:hypothetical protein [Helicobacter sp. 11S02629-2]|uniref:hypothetical protein n=1 Tax=Helicobacter sp. 11S02629-2 TaxID=1476195 RepID=UPI000BA6203E|nr:hypothetical protein [Helicobacter sp. 11S02629-2]PAF45379.1 hypothetical protein BKH40_04105 [Helicobacter sp. 11S02629-2]
MSEKMLHNNLEQIKKTINKLQNKIKSTNKKIKNYTKAEQAIRQALLFRLQTPTDETVEYIKNSQTTDYHDHDELLEDLQNENRQES